MKYKFYVPKFNRAENVVDYLKSELYKKELLTDDINKADYVIAVGDRTEMYDFILEVFRANIPIIHLWAGEISQGTHDEVYRHSMTLMSNIQLCTNEAAKKRVESLCNAIDKRPEAYIIGNLMLDDMDADNSAVPEHPYILVLYNPPTLLDRIRIIQEIEEIRKILREKQLPYIWIEPNGDKYSYLLREYVNTPTLPRAKFLGLIKHCEYFITNSSCQFYEAPFLMDKDKIISIGERNKERESKYSEMGIHGATKRIINVLENLR